MKSLYDIYQRILNEAYEMAEPKQIDMGNGTIKLRGGNLLWFHGGLKEEESKTFAENYGIGRPLYLTKNPWHAAKYAYEYKNNSTINWDGEILIYKIAQNSKIFDMNDQDDFMKLIPTYEEDKDLRDAIDKAGGMPAMSELFKTEEPYFVFGTGGQKMNFKSDINFIGTRWLQYINGTKMNGSKRSLGGIFMGENAVNLPNLFRKKKYDDLNFDTIDKQSYQTLYDEFQSWVIPYNDEVERKNSFGQTKRKISKMKELPAPSEVDDSMIEKVNIWIQSIKLLKILKDYANVDFFANNTDHTDGNIIDSIEFKGHTVKVSKIITICEICLFFLMKRKGYVGAYYSEYKDRASSGIDKSVAKRIPTIMLFDPQAFEFVRAINLRGNEEIVGLAGENAENSIEKYDLPSWILNDDTPYSDGDINNFLKAYDDQNSNFRKMLDSFKDYDRKKQQAKTYANNKAKERDEERRIDLMAKANKNNRIQTINRNAEDYFRIEPFCTTIEQRKDGGMHWEAFDIYDKLKKFMTPAELKAIDDDPPVYPSAQTYEKAGLKRTDFIEQ